MVAVASHRRDPHFYVTVYPHPGRPNDRQRLDHIDLNPDLTGLSWTSTAPGGFARFQAGHNNYERPLADPLIPRLLHMQDFARIEVTDGALTLWEGRTEDRDEAPKDRRTLVAAGWGYSAIHDMPYFSDSSTASTSGVVLKSVIANAAPFIRPASGDLYIDPLVEHAPDEFDAWYPSQVLDQITKEGDDDGNLMDWFVWESRTLWLKPRVAPATADYYLPFDRRYVSDWKRHVKDRRGIVWVDHTVSGIATRTGAVTAAGFTDEIGFQRGRVLKVGEMPVSVATRLAQTFLAFNSRERYTGVVTIGPDDVLIGAGGRPVPAYMARAGQWVQVGDYDPLMIVVQDYNANARRQKLTLGDRLDSYDVQVARTIRENELRKLGSNPLGGRT